MLTTFLIIGAVIGIVSCGALTFKDRCQLFEFAIGHQRDDIKSDLDSDWLSFKARANLTNDVDSIKTIWMGLVKGTAPATQIDVLRLSISSLNRFSYDEIYKWMLEYKVAHSTNVENLRVLEVDYKLYLKDSWFSFTNRYFKFPKDI